MIDRLALSEERIRALRERHPYQDDPAWVVEVARSDGWHEANIGFLHRERERAAEAMRDLMRELGVERVRSPAEAADLVALALEVFAPDGGFGGTVTRESDHTLRIINADCPVFEAIERAQWFGVTACPSWHRRRGWLDALGVQATDSVVGEKKWGDPACVSVIDIQAVLH